MRKVAALIAGVAMVASGLFATVPEAAAEPPVGPVSDDPVEAVSSDDLQTPAEQKQRALRQQAVADVLSGKREVEERNGSKVVNMGEKAPDPGDPQPDGPVDQYVELSRERTEKVFVILVEFGDERHPDFPDQDTDPETPGPVKFEGPLHNEIPKPDRRTDNSTMWEPDYSQQYYEDMYFEEGKDVESVKTYYEKQSSGRYSIDGQVTDWVKVKYNIARYGRSNGYPCEYDVCSNVQEMVKDGIDAWVVDQKAKGRTEKDIRADLASYDVWDRYDADGDGDFNEPDGYIDHFQIVHAGEGQADGNPIYGEDAPWSHRWAAFPNQKYGTGPADNPRGGVQIGKTGLWVSDYTMQSENDGMSTTAHEYAHDLGLPDLGGINSNNWWSMMAQSRSRAKNDEGIGTRAPEFGAWEKLQLGWLDYEIVPAGKTRSIELGPHAYNSAKAQGIVSVLPDKKVTTKLIAPPQGARQWWSGTGNDLNNTMTRTVEVPASSPKLTFKAAFDIEAASDTEPYDVATVEVDAGSGFEAIPGNITKGSSNGIFGTSAGWVDASFDLAKFAGKTVQLRFAYNTDGSTAGNDDDPGNNGLFIDQLVLSGAGGGGFSDDAESGPGEWQVEGFSIVGDTVVNTYDHFYIASNRVRVSYDAYLQYGPYNFGYGPSLPDKVDIFPYQEGLLVTYWDTTFASGATAGPGEGLILAIDSRPDLIYNLEGEAWVPRIQNYDAPFSLRKAESFTLHVNGKKSYVRGQNAQPLFDDTRKFWRDELPQAGVKTPGVGVTMRVLEQQGTSMKVRVGSKAPRPAGAR